MSARGELGFSLQHQLMNDNILQCENRSIITATIALARHIASRLPLVELLILAAGFTLTIFLALLVWKL